MKKKLWTIPLAVTLILAMLCACAPTQNPPASGEPPVNTADPAAAPIDKSTYTYADTIAWDGEYDVVVIGFGGAGAVSASYAADAGANVLITEKAPEGKEGGNSKVAGQAFGSVDDYELGLTYHRSLLGDHETPEAVLTTLVKGLHELPETMRNDFGVTEFFYIPKGGPATPEYPEDVFPGGETVTGNLAGPVTFDRAF